MNQILIVADESLRTSADGPLALRALFDPQVIARATDPEHDDRYADSDALPF